MTRVTVVLGLLAAAPALASASFPATVQSHLALAQQPACALCHLNGITGLGTVTTPFGRTLRAHGCLAANDATLISALDAMQADASDSDGDGVPDIQELLAGTDPNVASGGDGGVEPLPPIRYGCGASVAPGLLGALGALALLRVRRRR